MMKRKKLLFKVANLFLTLCVFMLSVPFVAAHEGNTENAGVLSYDSVLNNSIIVHANKAFYYFYGEKKYFIDENEKYCLPNVDKRVLIPISLMSELTGMKYTWNAKKELLNMSCNGNTVQLRLEEDSIIINGEAKFLNTPACFKGETTFVPFIEVMDGFGFNTYYDEGLSVASLTEELPLDKDDNIYIKEAINDLFYDYLFKSDFENLIPGSAKMFDGRMLAEGWTFNNWANPTRPAVDAGVISDDHASGEHCAFISAVNTSMSGFESVRMPFDKNKPGYEIEYKIKISKDYANNLPTLMVFLYDNTTYKTSVMRGTSVVDADGWTTNKFLLSKALYPDVDANMITVVLLTRYTGTDNAKASGALYIDDVKVSECVPDSYALKSDIRPNVDGSWYVVGDEVNYKPQSIEGLSSLKSIEGTVYNSYNEIVDKKVISADEMIKKGWSWKTNEPGFYEVEFTGVQPDGTRLKIVDYYCEMGIIHNVANQAVFERSKHGFVVAARKTKPMEERNKRMFFSSGAREPQSNYYADLIGFAGVRIHWIPWGPYGSDNLCISPQKGVYNWGFMDERIENIKKYNFDIIANVLYTPQWASSRADFGNQLSSYGMYKYSVYAPADIADWEDFITRLVERYKDDIKMWEIWNEPHVPGGSAFWEDTPENYVELLKSAYTQIKKIQPDSIVTIGGIGARRYTPFYKAIMKTDVNDYFDVLAMHGTQLDPWTYNNIAKKEGYEPKEYMNTEGHYILINSQNTEKHNYTETALSMYMMKEYFRDIKFGALLTTMFLVQDKGQYEIETMPFYKKTGLTKDASSMFRNKPYIEPRQMTSVLHTFFDIIGKDLSFESEYLLNDSQQAVLFNNDGKPLLCVWTENGSKFKLDDKIIDCMTKDSEIYNWEGKRITTDNYMLTGNTMYYITGLDKEKLSTVETSEDAVIYNEVQVAKKNIQVPTANATQKPLFDLKTFKEIEDINWIDTDWKWVKNTDDKTEDFAAKFALSMDKSGMYIMADVQDNSFTSNEKDGPGNSWMYDSIQFAMDTVGESALADRLEFQAGMVNGRPTLYKEAAPYIGGNLIPNWSKAGSVLSEKYIRIENVDGHIIYKIFIPVSELYPYAYVGQKEVLRFSFLANNNNGTGRMGYLEWSSGIGASKDPEYYGKINIE